MDIRTLNKDSEYNKEMQKWEAPYVHKEWPKMVFRAIRKEGEGYWVVTGSDAIRAKTQKIVNDEFELQRAHESGWRPSPQEAIDFANKRFSDKSELEAARNYEDRNMSEAAKREAEEFASSAEDPLEPVAEIPEKPKKRRRRVV